jgi:hypothetical protein
MRSRASQPQRRRLVRARYAELSELFRQRMLKGTADKEKHQRRGAYELRKKKEENID